MATRMQQRRGTAAQWVSTNNGDGPILEAGEIGFETDTGKFKIGDGANHWVDLDYFLDESDITGITGDYVLASTLGQANGVATLDSSGKLTGSQIPGIDELAQDAVDLALVAGTGISKSYNDNANTITISTNNIPNASLANSAVTINGFSISLGGSASYSSDNIEEGTTNLYFTNARAQAAVSADISSAINALSTTDIEEGTNQYFTNARVRAAVDGGTGLDYNSSTGTFDIDSTVTTNTGNQTLTNKNIDLANNTVTGTVAQFNSALSDANFVTTADTGTVTSAMIADEAIVNADISNTAAIAQSKIDGLTTDLAAKAALSGATFTGNVVVEQNFQVDGNFTVNGSNVLVSATQIQIEDSILQLAHENAANTVDLGIVAGYNDGSAKHAGLVKDVSDSGKWKLFKNVSDEPSTTVNFAQATLDDLVVGGLEATTLTVGNVSNTEIGYLANVTSDIQSQIDGKISASSTDTLLNKTVNLANNTVSGTIAQFNTALSDADFATLAGTETLSNKTLANATVTGTITAGGTTGTSTQYLKSTGTGVEWSTLSVPITTGTTSVDSSPIVDTIALNSFTTAEYTLSVKKGSKVRSSKILVQTDGSTVDSSEFGITETGGEIEGISVTADSNGGNARVNVNVPSEVPTTWTTRTSNFGSTSIFDAEYGNGIWVLSGGSGQLRTSTDTISWTTVTSNFGTTAILSIAYGNSLWVAGGDNGQMRTSTDTISWTTVTSNFTSSINNLAFGDGIWVAVGSNGRLRTSTDAVTWTTQSHGFGSTSINGLAYANNLWAIGGSNGLIQTSTDAVTWTTVTSNMTNVGNIAYGNGIWVAVGSLGNLRTSTDTITWTTQTSNFGTSGIFELKYGNGVWVIAGEAGQLRTSTDTITWTTQNSNFEVSGFITASGFGNGTWVIGGSGGNLRTSSSDLSVVKFSKVVL